jgi:hypothetical protein
LTPSGSFSAEAESWWEGSHGTEVVGKAFDGLVLKPGQTHDVGDVRVKGAA